mmetsp:Transcript_82898/g.173569  ORF Transcript_82898/g.173569 Transcript_82898/m.173569 type:complete len:214 (-) Transcript_82898:93-734(-)
MPRAAAGLNKAALLLAAALLNGGASALFFELKPGTEECFRWRPESGHHCVGSFEADGPEEGIEVRMLGPDDKELWRLNQPSGQLKPVDAHSAGENFALCFKSTISDNQMISFDWRWGLEHELDLSDSKELKQFVTQNHTAQMQESVAQLYRKTLDILEQQEFAITREAVHRETAESTNSRVLWWTIVEAIFLVVLAMVQVYILRSYFEVKSII